MDYKILNFTKHGDNDGSLVALQNGNELPFEVKRCYYIFDTKQDVVRGNHAHPNLKQVIVALHGRCDFILDDGFERETIHLDNPCKGIYIYGNLWRAFTNFSNGCVVAVFADQLYEDTVYIRSYEEFKRKIRRW